MADVFLSEPDEIYLKTLDPGTQQEVARVMSLLEDDSFREHNKADLCIVEDGMRLWYLCVGRIWLAFVKESDGSITVVHLSIQSLFRAF